MRRYASGHEIRWQVTLGVTPYVRESLTMLPSSWRHASGLLGMENARATQMSHEGT